ncbi:hypothetical protein BpHYR1_008338 [Brachionus plicatilis]|uniref:Uncharacterized protein n=1 Tax=Brachionus plicatilis TaxID=10195 RepID=A0A3M7SCK7_BRAPC|nr:hypothetical protein BpHYR1_008338 [Brachionus plicatilis]
MKSIKYLVIAVLIISMLNDLNAQFDRPGFGQRQTLQDPRLRRPADGLLERTMTNLLLNQIRRGGLSSIFK